jgi:predicted aspartyl protease
LALIDTGASDSCIDEQLAQQLGLMPVDRRQVGGVAGQQLHYVYLAHLTVPNLGMQTLGPFIGVNLGGVHKVIMGRDFLTHTILIYNGEEGEITICN